MEGAIATKVSSRASADLQPNCQWIGMDLWVIIPKSSGEYGPLSRDLHPSTPLFYDMHFSGGERCAASYLPALPRTAACLFLCWGKTERRRRLARAPPCEA